MEFVKIGKNAPQDRMLIFELAQEFNVSEKLIEILVGRQINTREKIKSFLYANNSQFNNPFQLKNMHEITERIKQAAENKEKVVVFGDYDVDGITACYVLISYFKTLGIEANGFIPHRIADGYGLTESAINDVKNKYNPSLIITVDCGISCHNEIEYIKKLGIDVIVTDHHDIPPKLPDCLILNPKLEGQEYPFNKLCGAGVALKLVQALGGTPAIEKFLPAVAIATIADIVSLTEENRAIVKLGFKNAKKHLPLGLKKLCEKSDVKKITAQTVAFKIAPKINAPGRMGDSSLVLKLFLEQDEKEADKLADEICEINVKRQEVGNLIFDDCHKIVNSLNISKVKSIVFKNENWEAGLLGIACAKICSEVNRPVFLFSEVDGLLKGSARSIHGINIMDALTYARSEIVNFGGHEMAAGLSIKKENFETFKQKIEEFCCNKEFETCFKNKLEYDIELNAEDVTYNFVNELLLLEPTGCENKMPIFKLNFNSCTFSQNKKCPEHLFIKMQNQNLIAFQGARFTNYLNNNNQKSALVELSLDEFRGKTSIKGIVKYIKGNCLGNLIDIYNGFLSFYSFDNDFKDPVFETYKNIVAKSFGTCYVSFNGKGALKFAKENSINVEEFLASDYNGESVVLIAPYNIKDFKNFNEVIFLDEEIPLNLICKINKISDAKVYIPENFKDAKANVSCNREIFASYFKLIKMQGSKIDICFNEICYFYKLKKHGKNLSFGQFMFCLKVFEELGFVKTEKTNCTFKIKVNKNIPKKNLTDSKLYSKFLH